MYNYFGGLALTYRRNKMASNLVFVTVGTTEFDLLIQKVLESNLLSILYARGYRKILLQIGNGKYVPEEGTREGIEINYYRFKDSLMDDINQAELVVSHAGAGSCLEILQLGKPLIVVTNEELMGNHQAELAEALSKRNHVGAATPGTLLNAIRSFDESKLTLFPEGDPNAFVGFLNNIMGIKH